MTAPKGYENLNDPAAPQHHWDGPLTRVRTPGEPQPTCCFCRIAQKELIQVPQPGCGPYGPSTPAIRDHTDGICAARPLT